MGVVTHCNCGHPQERHGPRMAREGKPRTLAAACLEPDCPCELLTPAGANRAKLSDVERDRRIRSLERQVRQIQLQIQELKQ